MRKLLSVLIIGVFLTITFCSLSFGATFHMKTGEVLTGDIVSYDGKMFRVKSNMGILSMEVKEIENITGNNEEGLISVFTGTPSYYEPDRITGTIEYIREGELRIKTKYGYMVINDLNTIVGIDLKLQEDTGTGVKVTKKIKLRNESADLPKETIIKMVQEKNFSYPSERIIGMYQPKYEVKTMNGAKVVIEHNTGLMWQQSGSSEKLDYYKGAKNYIILLNRQRYAGFSDWRLPTIEEWMSLMEPLKKDNGLYIDPIFDTIDSYYWSNDEKSPGGRWIIYFRDGEVDDIVGGKPLAYVRAIRSLK
jgi:hypothetical protein